MYTIRLSSVANGAKQSFLWVLLCSHIFPNMCSSVFDLKSCMTLADAPKEAEEEWVVKPKSKKVCTILFEFGAVSFRSHLFV